MLSFLDNKYDEVMVGFMNLFFANLAASWPRPEAQPWPLALPAVGACSRLCHRASPACAAAVPRLPLRVPLRHTARWLGLKPDPHP
jgi:hypothetical protein